MIEELSPVVKGARVEKVFDRGAHAFILRLRTREGRFSLLFSVRPGLSRFHLLAEPPRAPRAPSALALELRELLRGAVLQDIDQPSQDRLVRFSFTLGREGEPRARCLILEMFGRAGRLIIYEGDERVTAFVTGRGGVSRNQPYRFPAPPRRSEKLLFPINPTQLIPEESRGEPLAFHHALEKAMEEAEGKQDWQEHHGALTRQVSGELKRRRRLQVKLDDDLREAERWQEWE
ncbi:MAG: NFACT family protein, partial [Planctomycetota bacterium]